jgi:hypothetical protein
MSSIWLQVLRALRAAAVHHSIDASVERAVAALEA